MSDIDISTEGDRVNNMTIIGCISGISRRNYQKYSKLRQFCLCDLEMPLELVYMTVYRRETTSIGYIFLEDMTIFPVKKWVHCVQDVPETFLQPDTHRKRSMKSAKESIITRCRCHFAVCALGYKLRHHSATY